MTYRYCQSVIRILELSGSVVSHWAWDQRHDGKQHLCLLLGFTLVKGGQLRTSFKTNVTILTSISHITRTWVAIFHLHQLMTFLFHSSYGITGPTHLMDVLFRGRCDFHINFLGRNIAGNVWDRLPGSSMIDMRSSSNNMKSPFPKSYIAFSDMPIYSATFNWSHFNKSWLCCRIGLWPYYRSCSIFKLKINAMGLFPF